MVQELLLMDDDEFNTKFNLIKTERSGILDMILELLTACKQHKKLLDMNYANLYFYIACVQTSVIIFSTFSAFTQALGTSVNIPEDAQFIISLVISTYISLTLSLSKFFKLDEKKENVHNIREKFAELHNKIRYRIDVIKPWVQRGYINKQNINEQLENWKTEKDTLLADYFKMIEIKESLFKEFEKTIDTNLRNKYAILSKVEELDHENNMYYLNKRIIKKDGMTVCTQTESIIVNNEYQENSTESAASNIA